MEITEVINFLPISYSKLIGAEKRPKSQVEIRNLFLDKGIKIINIQFQDVTGKKLSHGVKKIKGEFIQSICESGKFDYNNYDFYQEDNIIYVKIIVD